MYEGYLDVACYRPWVSVRHILLQGQCSPRPGPRFTWHSCVWTEALETGTATVELSDMVCIVAFRERRPRVFRVIVAGLGLGQTVAYA